MASSDMIGILDTDLDAYALMKLSIFPREMETEFGT